MAIKLLDLYEGTGIRSGALEFLYELMRERQAEPEVNISNSGLPTFEHHRAFWTRRPYRAAYLIEFAAETPEQARSAGGFIAPVWVGYVSATNRNEIDIVLLKDHRGRGIGPEAVREFTRRHQPLQAQAGERRGHWLANINPANERSIKTFTKLGFRKIQETFQLIEEEHHGNEKTARPA